MGYFIVIRVTWFISVDMVKRVIRVLSVVRIIPVIGYLNASRVIGVRVIRVIWYLKV